MSVLDQLLPGLIDRKLIRTIKARLLTQEAKRQSGLSLDRTWEKYRKIPEEGLRDSLRAELSRRDQFHRRAQTFLSSIAVLSAFTIGSTSLLRGQGSSLATLLIKVGIIGTLFYLASGAWFALETIQPDTVADAFLQTRMEGEEILPVSAWTDTLLYLIQRNQAQNLIFASVGKRSYRSIRNGLIFLVTILGALALR